MTKIENGKNKHEIEWENEHPYVSLSTAMWFINQNGFRVKTRPTFIKLEKTYALPYQVVHTGSTRPRRRYSKEGLKDFVQHPEKYLILNKEGLFAYLAQHGFECETDEDFEELQKFYRIPCIIRDPNKPHEKIYTIKELEPFVNDPTKFAIKRQSLDELE